MLEEFKNIKSGKKELKEFGLTMAIALSVVSVLLFLRKGVFSRTIFIAAMMFFFLSFWGNFFLKPLHKIWIGLSIILGKLTNIIILTALFYLVLLPIGLIMRLFKGDFFGFNFDKKTATYWQIKTKGANGGKEYYGKQF